MVKRIVLLVSLFGFSLCSLLYVEEVEIPKKSKNVDKNDNLNVSFTKVVLNNEDITSSSIGDGGRSFMFTVNKLSAVGDSENLTYTISNNSDKDLNIRVTCKNTKQFIEYYTFNNTYEKRIINNQIMDGNISITLNKVSEKEIKEMFMCNLSYTV